MLPTMILQLGDFTTVAQFDPERTGPTLGPHPEIEPLAVFADILALRGDADPAVRGIGGYSLPAGGNPLPSPLPTPDDGPVEDLATRSASLLVPALTLNALPETLPQQVESIRYSPPVIAAPAVRIPEPPHPPAAQAPGTATGDGTRTVSLPIYPPVPAMNIVSAAGSTNVVSSTGAAPMIRPEPGDVVVRRRTLQWPSVSSTPLAERPPLQVDDTHATATSVTATTTEGEKVLHQQRHILARTPPVPVAAEQVVRQFDAAIATTVTIDPTEKIAVGSNPLREVTPLPQMLPVPQILPSPAAAVVAPELSAVQNPPGGQIQISPPLISATGQSESGMQTVQVSRSIDVPVSDARWGERLGDRVLLMASNKLQSAEIRLTPAELGPLRVQVAIDDGAANVTFHALNAVTREAIEQALPRLRELLADNGLSLNETNVAEQGDHGVKRDSRDTSDDRQATRAPESPAEPLGEDKPLHGSPPSLSNGLVDTFV